MWPSIHALVSIHAVADTLSAIYQALLLTDLAIMFDSLTGCLSCPGEYA